MKHGEFEGVSREVAVRAQQTAEAMRRERRFDAGLWVGLDSFPDAAMPTASRGHRRWRAHSGISPAPQPGPDPEGKALKTVRRLFERLDWTNVLHPCSLFSSRRP